MSLNPEKPKEHKREHGRLKVTVDGHYRFTGDEDWMPCSLIDISTRGIALVGKKSFYVGDKIEVRFGLEKRTVLVELEITNLIGKKAGGKVTGMTDADRTAIQDILNRDLLSGNTPLS
jgi:PilZ domain